MGILFRHLTIVQLFLWGFKDVAFVDLLTISGETVVECHSELSLNCSSDCGDTTWKLQHDNLAEIQPGHRSSRLTIQNVTRADDMKYTCIENCRAGTKRKSAIVTVYSLGKPVLSTPQPPRSGQPFTVTCELLDFYPETAQLLLLLSDNDMEVKKLMVTDYDGTVEVTASNQQKTTSTMYKCEALMTLEGNRTIRTFTDLLVQPEEPKTTTKLATSTQQNILSTSPFRPASTEDDLVTKIRETPTDSPNAPTESSTAESQHKHQVAAEPTAALVRTEQNILSTPPFAPFGTLATTGRDDFLNRVTTVTGLYRISEPAHTGGVRPNVGLYVLSTLGVVASIASMGTALFLVLYRKRKRRQERTEDEDEMEKEKEKQQLPELSP